MSVKAEQTQKRAIRALFTRIAKRYDIVNRVISLGQDQRWREVALIAVAASDSGRLLDVATGTGDLALLARRLYPELQVVGTDLTPAMLEQAQQKARASEIGLPWTISDGLALAFADDSFDAVTSAFMMRNVPDVAQAFAEQARVVRPGGRVVCLEMSWPRHFLKRWLFGLYFFIVPPLFGFLASGAHAPYRYLPRSVRSFLEPGALADTMVQAGLHNVTWQARMLGSVVIHTGVKSISPSPNA